MKSPKAIVFLSMSIALAIAAYVIAQNQPEQPTEKKPEYGVMKLNSKKGSFGLEGEGKVEMTFTGCLMIKDLAGTHTLEGKYRKEFDDFGRVVYFADLDASGKPARAVIEGKWRRIQWFGGNLVATWRGHGLANIFGEFDEEGNTGTVQVDDGQVLPWFSTGRTVYVPESAGMPQWDPNAAPPEGMPDHDHSHEGHTH